MEQVKIEAIVKKYWAGQTSLEEEQILFERASEIEDLGTRALITQMKRVRNANYSEQVQEVRHSFKLVRLLRSSWAYAAGLALLLVGSYSWQQWSNVSSPRMAKLEETYTSPEEALEQTEAALAYVFKKMKKGQEPATSQFKKIESLNIVIPN